MHRAWIVMFVAGILSAGVADGAETSADRLGYPAGKRVLVLCADFMGAAYEFNASGQRLLSDDLVQSAALMPACPWFSEFAGWCRENPGHDVGVCLTLINPSTKYRWGPVCSRDTVPSLVNADGYLWETETRFALRADADEVRREIRAQIKRVREAGVRPTHLYPFLGSVLTRADLLQVYLETAEEYWIPAVMMEMKPEIVERFRQDGFPLSPEMLELIADYRLPKLDDLHLLPDADSYEAKREAFFELVKNLPPGLTQIVAGPAIDSDALQLITDDWQNRVWDDQLLADPDVGQFLKDEGVLLTNWKEIMERFENGNEADPKKPRSGPTKR